MAKPEAKLLNEYLKDLVYWEGFALQLPNFKQSHIDTIKREESNNIAEQKQAMVYKWLQLYPDASWKDVASALEVVDENWIATRIRETFLDHHSQKESSLPSALEVVDENWIATRIRETFLDHHSQKESSLPSKSQEMDEVEVEEGVVTNLEHLHDSFVSLTEDIIGEVECAEKKECFFVERLVRHTEQEKAFPVSLDSVSTSNGFFRAIKPHYNFLNYYLLLSLTKFLSYTIETESQKYKKNVKSFMKNTMIKHLRQKLKHFFLHSQFDNQVRVIISLQNAWGDQNVWLVEQLVVQLFSLKHPDQCQWFRIISGSFCIAFLVDQSITEKLVENSKMKVQFMRLVGVFQLQIGSTFVLEDKEDEKFTFEYSLIQATKNNDTEVVQFLAQFAQVNVAVAVRNEHQVKEEMVKPEAKLLNEHLKDLVYWEGFALQLPNFKQSHIDTIKREESNNIAEQKQAMVNKWLQLYPDASWKDVASALEVVDENWIATRIRETFLDHHSQKESSLPSALEVVDENWIATRIRETFLDHHSQKESSLPSKSQEMDEVEVEEGVVTNLEHLHDSFVSLTEDIIGEVECAEKKECFFVERLVRHTEQEKAFPVSLDSVSTSNGFFRAIKPHYNFLNYYLLLSLTKFLSYTIETESQKYKKNVKSFMKNTMIKHLRQKLKHFFLHSQFDNQVRVIISLQNAWGDQNVWLVEQLVVQLFSLKHPDQCQWFRIISGSFCIAFLVDQSITEKLVENSKMKVQFMRLVGVFQLQIGSTFVLEDKEDEKFTFEYSLIQATKNNDTEVVQFLAQFAQVNVAVAVRNEPQVKEEMVKPEAKLLNKHLQDLVYWERFALQLPNFRQSLINIIKREESKIAGQKQAMVNKWLQLYPNALWECVESALEVIGQNLITKRARKTFLDHHSQKESSLQSKRQEMKEEVAMNVEFHLVHLHHSFVSLIVDIIGEVESAEKNKCPIVKRLVKHTEQHKAFPVSLNSVSTSDDFFHAIKPHYNFLNFYLLLSLTIFLSDTIATKSRKYAEDVQSFMMYTKIEDLPQKLKHYFNNSQFDNQVKVIISLQNAWGTQNVWLVKQLVRQLFSLEHPDQCQWFDIISGCFCIAFLVDQSITEKLVKNSKMKVQFMRLVGVFQLQIGSTFVIEGKEDKKFTFEYSLFQATKNNNAEVVRFLLQLAQVDVNSRYLDSPAVAVKNEFEVKSFIPLYEKILEAFDKTVEMFEVTLETMVCNGAITVSTLMTATERELLPNLVSVKTSGDFIQAIKPYYSPLSCQLLVTVAFTLLEKVGLLAKKVFNLITDFKAAYPLACLKMAMFHSFQKHQPDINIKISLKLENVWEQFSINILEILVQSIFLLNHPDECQWFRVLPGSIMVVFLAAKHKMMKLIVNSVKRREWMRLTGVISLKVGNIYTFIREGNIEYSVEKAIAEANKLHYSEIVAFLQCLEREPLERDEFREFTCITDNNNNCFFSPYPDSTALMTACSNGDTQLVKLLLDNKADPNIPNKLQFTASMYAVMNSKVVSLLLAHNADVNALTICGESALYWACRFGNIKVIKMLLKVGVNLINQKDENGRTPLYIACHMGHMQAVEQLIQAKADLSMPNNDGDTPLHEACLQGHLQIVEKLLQSEIDPNVQNNLQMTPLYVASHINHLQVVKRLLEANADPNIQTSTGTTPLFLASAEGNIQLMDLLLQAQADSNIQAYDGSTPLYTTSWRGYLNAVELLLQAQADPNIQDIDGATPLFVASKGGHVDVVEMLLKATADPVITNNQGDTPIMAAFRNGHLPVVDLLLKSQQS